MLALTRQQMAELDRLMVEEFGIDIVVMMEHAGFDVATLAYRMLNKEGNVAVLVGHGNNGGDGLCAARHLLNNGHSVSIYSASPKEKFAEEPLRQLNIMEKLDVDIRYVGETDEIGFGSMDLIIDSLLGYNLSGDPKGAFAHLIRKANESKKKILAVDLPSGLDADTGVPGKPCIKATCTLTLGYSKVGLLNEIAKGYVGEVYLGYISIPDKLYEKLGLTKINFKKSSVVKLMGMEG